MLAPNTTSVYQLGKCVNVNCQYRQLDSPVCNSDEQALYLCGIRKNRDRWNEPRYLAKGS